MKLTPLALTITLIILTTITSITFSKELPPAELRAKYQSLDLQYRKLRRDGKNLRQLDSLIDKIKTAKKNHDYKTLETLLDKFQIEITTISNRQQNHRPVTRTLITSSKAETELEVLNALKSESHYLSLLHFRGHPRLVDSSGAIGRNIKYFSDVGAQRDALWLIRRGFIEDNIKLIEQAVGACEYAFAHQNKLGYFNNGHGIEPLNAISADAFFLQAFSQLYLLIQASQYKTLLAPRLHALLPKLRIAIEWLATNQLELKQQDKHASNRLVLTGLAFYLNGKILNSKKLQNLGIEFLTLALDAQLDNGVFSENGGYDSSYQAVSILYLSIAWTHVTDITFRKNIFSALEKSIVWEKTRILVDGKVEVKGNSRTGLGQEIFFGKAKDVNYPQVALAMFVWGKLANDKEAIQLANRVVKYIFKRRGY